MDDPNLASEYVLARRALLDVLGVLKEQLPGLILVGAQAVYLHAPADRARQVTYTTDGDLAIDPELLSAHPDIGEVLLAAGYTLHSSPGRFFTPDGIPIDFMVPSGALPASRRRTADLAGQSPGTARRTAGLELALLDSAPTTITALDSTDRRSVTLRVAGPAALTVAKLFKLQERLAGSRRDRVLSKDAGDLLRLLRYCDAARIGARLRELRFSEVARATVESATGYLREELDSASSPLVGLAVADLEGIEPARQVEAAFRTLGKRLTDAYTITAH